MKKQAAMNAEEKVGWEEIVDSRLDGRFDLQEVNEVAALAYKCISRAPRKRPNMRDVVQVLARVVKVRHSRKRQKMSSSPYPMTFPTRLVPSSLVAADTVSWPSSPSSSSPSL